MHGSPRLEASAGAKEFAVLVLVPGQKKLAVACLIVLVVGGRRVLPRHFVFGSWSKNTVLEQSRVRSCLWSKS